MHKIKHGGNLERRVVPGVVPNGIKPFCVELYFNQNSATFNIFLITDNQIKMSIHKDMSPNGISRVTYEQYFHFNLNITDVLCVEQLNKDYGLCVRCELHIIVL